MIPKNNLLILGSLEGLVMFSAIIRIAFPGSLDLARTAHVGWLMATLLISAAGLAHYVVRSARLGVKIAAGEAQEDDRKQVFILSVAIEVAAGLLSAAGPHAVERLLG